MVLVSLAAVFWAVTQRSTQKKVGGALRDSPKNGCEGDYDGLRNTRYWEQGEFLCNFHDVISNVSAVPAHGHDPISVISERLLSSSYNSHLK